MVEVCEIRIESQTLLQWLNIDILLDLLQTQDGWGKQV
jgi:hypothetical protein